MTENLDAMRALEYIPIDDRDMFKSVLSATLVKHHRHEKAFDTVFEVYFSLFSDGVQADGDDELVDSDEGALQDGQAQGGAGGTPMSREELIAMLMNALQNMDRDALRRLAAAAVQQFAGMEPGRPVGGTYYLYRTLRQLDLDDLQARLMAEARERGEVDEGELADRLAHEEYQARLKELRELIEEEIRRRLVADRGVEAMARTLRKPLPEDIEFMHASREEMLALQQAVYPLTRAMAARLAQRRRRRHRGHLDFRKTIRESLSYGGRARRSQVQEPAPVEARDHGGRRHLGIGGELRPLHAAVRVRDGEPVLEGAVVGVHRRHRRGDEVLPGVGGRHRRVQRVNTEADVIWVDGHSDYGHAFETWHQRHFHEITPKTSIILLGDARNNYHASEAWVVDEMRKRGRHVYWLDPEPRGYWDTGDSIVSEYGKYCDGVFECRNLRQLTQFVGTHRRGLTLPHRSCVKVAAYVRNFDAC